MNKEVQMTPDSTQPNQPQQINAEEIMTRINIDFSMLRFRASMLEFKKEKYNIISNLLDEGKMDDELKGKLEAEQEKLINEILTIPSA